MKRLILLAALVGAVGCYEPAEFVYPIDTTSLVFQVPRDCDGEQLLDDEDYTCMGIHPDVSVLTDSNNPLTYHKSAPPINTKKPNNSAKPATTFSQ